MFHYGICPEENILQLIAIKTERNIYFTNKKKKLIKQCLKILINV
jgi:hypothetical protein